MNMAVSFSKWADRAGSALRRLLSAAMFRRFHSRPARLSCALGTSGHRPLIGHKNTKAAMPAALKSALRVRSLTLIFPPK
jgi:hypothetical protein